MQDEKRLAGLMENILFAAGDSVEIDRVAQALGLDAQEMDAFLAREMEARRQGHGLVIMRFDDKIQLATRADCADTLYALFGEQTKEDLTRAMMETLAIIAYKQPVTRAEVEELRGVNSSYVLNSLAERGLIEEAGRKDVVGKPKLYRTGEAFLRHFGISSVEELPPVPKREE